MFSQRVIDNLKEYEDLPMTKERQELNRKYLDDEISHIEFYNKAMDYLHKVKADKK